MSNGPKSPFVAPLCGSFWEGPSKDFGIQISIRLQSPLILHSIFWGRILLGNFRKVSDGVGVDGVGAKFLLCSFWQFFPWPKTEGQSTATAWKCSENAKFSSTRKEQTGRTSRAELKRKNSQAKCKHDRETQKKNNEKQRKKGTFTPIPSIPTPLRTSQNFRNVLAGGTTEIWKLQHQNCAHSVLSH